MLKRRTASNDVKGDPTACTNSAPGNKKKKFNALDDDPPGDDIFGAQFMSCNEERTSIFMRAVGNLIAQYTHGFETDKHSENLKNYDGVFAYAKEVLTLGSLYMEYINSVREGDGIRILRCWRFLLVIFKATGKRKYSIQAATLLFQYNHYIFTDRMKHQLLWSRTANVHGKLGKNIAMDLYMEHLNQELKNSVSHLGANVTENTIKRVGFCLRQLIAIRNNYDRTTGLPAESGWHF